MRKEMVTTSQNLVGGRIGNPKLESERKKRGQK
jgi:hypothetical protein